MNKYSDIINEAKGDDPQLRKAYERIKTKIRAARAKGLDTSALEAEREKLYNDLVASRMGGSTTNAAPTMTGEQPGGTPAQPTDLSKLDAEERKGYEAALKAIKDAMSGKGKKSGGKSSGSQSGLAPIPSDPSDQDGDSGGGSGDDEMQKAAQKAGNKGQTRAGKQSGQGVVRPEDCSGQNGSSSINKTPGAAGGMISREDGDKLAQAEGYDKEGGNSDSCEREWAERAQKAASQMAGKGEGWEKLKAKIDGLYRATKDWKKELKKIVGQSISPEDKRQAYANKNILVSQDRIARTDKDKYDNVDYIMAWIDTSGSMSDEYLRQCLAEVYAVALAKKPLKIVVVQFDTRIADVQEFRSVNDLKRSMKSYTLKGGGGTEVKPCFDMLLKDRRYARRPAELVMIFTDGYLTQYKRNPRTMRHLVWVVVDNIGFDLQYKDINTKLVRIKTSDLGK